MLNLDLLGNGEALQSQTRSEALTKALSDLSPLTRNFIQLCIHPDPSMRPKANALLKQPVLQEVSTSSQYIYSTPIPTGI